ncbi:hypothetical protein LENED_004782 [Lentinula edodes]|uniref:Uncharacterized protein n=1 Tax=Lentinula edodes TaxID=5353 RepID=A0A1Q3E7Q0_LENED|nr:hypothetical protein LENED_004782 [Lentinula edodes]
MHHARPASRRLWISKSMIDIQNQGLRSAVPIQYEESRSLFIISHNPYAIYTASDPRARKFSCILLSGRGLSVVPMVNLIFKHLQKKLRHISPHFLGLIIKNTVSRRITRGSNRPPDGCSRSAWDFAGRCIEQGCASGELHCASKMAR